MLIVLSSENDIVVVVRVVGVIDREPKLDVDCVFLRESLWA